MSSTQLGSIERICPLGYFGFGGIEKFCAQKLGQGNLSQFKMILNYIKYSCIIFCFKLRHVETGRGWYGEAAKPPHFC